MMETIQNLKLQDIQNFDITKIDFNKIKAEIFKDPKRACMYFNYNIILKSLNFHICMGI